MSYLNHAQDPRRRSAAVSGVVGIHVLLALGLLSGLEVDFERIVVPRIGTVDIPLDPPPPPPPEPRERQQTRQSDITAPLPPLDLVTDDPLDDVVAVDPAEDLTLVIDTGTRIEPVVEPVRPAFTPRRARPSNDPLRWLSTDDYPARALRAEAEGVAAYRLIVGTSGRASACEVTRSTGNGQLDDATCDFILRRARFEPATDESGRKVLGSYTGTVKWEIPE